MSFHQFYELKDGSEAPISSLLLEKLWENIVQADKWKENTMNN